MGDRLPSSFDSSPEMLEANAIAKLGRKMKKEPLIPLGVAATCYALFRAYKSMKVGDSREMNRMLRARIYAQGFTLLAMVAGGYYYGAERAQEKELNKALEAKRQQDKKDAWIKELETRDREDKEWKERHAAVEQAAKVAEQMRPGATSVKTESTPPPTAKEGAEKVAKEPVEGEGEGETESKKGSGVLSAVKDLLNGSK